MKIVRSNFHGDMAVRRFDSVTYEAKRNAVYRSTRNRLGYFIIVEDAYNGIRK